MPAPTGKHTFLSHNSADKHAVEELARRLEKEGITCWLDKWHLIPGDTWQEGLEAALKECRSCVVFLGPSGLGPWQNEEMRRAIARRVQDAGSDTKFRVIPVVLPGALRDERSSLPDFLVRATWVEFQQSLDEPDAFHRLKCGILGIAPGAAPGESILEGESPYRGLEAFQPQHEALYFGREADISWIMDQLRAGTRSGQEARFLAIVGASGSGKSSLARAGVVPALKNGGLPGSESWPIVIFRPGPNPLESLAVAMAKEPALKSGAGDAGDFEKRLLAEENRLHLAVRQAIDEQDETRRAVLVVDQFEEVYTVCEDEKQRRAFIANLLYASTVPGGRTIVIPAMRADFYPKCAAYPKLAAALSDHQLLLGPLDRENLREVIERPAQLAGCEFEPGLVEMLLDDMENQPPGALPLLEHCLHQLWERREGGRRLTVEAYKAIGKIEGALERHADTIFESLQPAEQEACARLFIQLVRPGEGSADTKRQARLDRAAPDETSRHLVSLLASKDARLLTSGGDAQPRAVAPGKAASGSEASPVVEITHEALIVNWGRLRRWIEDNRKSIRVQQRLEESAREWHENGRKAKYLDDGARLEEGKEWMKANAKLANTFATEFAFVRAGQRRANQRTQILFAFALAALALAVGALFTVELSLRSRDEARKQDADLALEKVKFNPKRYPGAILHPARAIGFSGFGGQPYQKRDFIRFWSEAWNLVRNFKEPFPVLDPDKQADIRQELEKTVAYLPFWRSEPLVGGDVQAIAFADYGRVLQAQVGSQVWQWNLADPSSTPAKVAIESDLAPLGFGPDVSILKDDKSVLAFHAYGHDVELAAHPAAVTAWALDPKKNVIVTGLADGTLIAWDLRAAPLGQREDLIALVEQDEEHPGWFRFDNQQGKDLVHGSQRGGAFLAAQWPSMADPALLPVSPKTGAEWRNSIGMNLLWVEKGLFLMGSPANEPERSEGEFQHQVTLTTGFWMGQYEVTQAEWAAVMEEDKRYPASRKDPMAPVENVSWDHAREFCVRLTEREVRAGRLTLKWRYELPTEAQWEYACRAGTQTPFSLGDTLNGALANCDGNYPYPKGKISPGPFKNNTVGVGQYRANPWGFHDMHGNVYEWCLDWYGEYEQGPVADPTGPKQATGRVIRGGGWSNFAQYCRSAYRDWDSPNVQSSGLGFRPVLSAQVPAGAEGSAP